MTEQHALGFGAHAVDHSAAATFYVKPTKTTAKKPLLSFHSWEDQEKMFYPRKLKDDTIIYIEKSQHRISTPGEISGISALGWRSQMERAQNVAHKQQIRNQLELGTKKAPKQKMFDDPFGATIDIEMKGIFATGRSNSKPLFGQFKWGF